MIKILNTNTKKYIEFGFNTYVLNKKDLGIIEADHLTTKSIGQMGEYLTGTTLQSRDIALTGYIISQNKAEMETRKKDLIDLINPLHDLQVINDNKNKLDCKATSSIQFSTDYKDNNDFICKFIVDCFCANPFWTNLTESKIDIALWIPAFHFPLVIPTEKIIMGYRSPSTIVNIENKGNIEIGMRIEFKALGSLTNPSLLNVNTQELLKIEKEMVYGETITANTNFGKKRVTQTLNGVESNAFPYLKRGSIFLQLESGSNLFRYDAEVNPENLEVNVYYTPLFLGVV